MGRKNAISWLLLVALMVFAVGGAALGQEDDPIYLGSDPSLDEPVNIENGDIGASGGGTAGVPEPATIVGMIGLGLMGGLWFLWRRKHAK